MAKRQTVAQIYIGEQHIDGFNELRALGLDPYLQAKYAHNCYA